MYHIEGNLYQGALPEGDHDFDVVVSLVTANEFANQVTPLCTIWMPFEDGTFPGIKWLSLAVSLLESALEQRQKVYVHCRMGRSRSVTLVAAYLMKKHAWSPDKALETIASVNPEVDPALRLRIGLKEWHEKLRKS